MIGISTAKGVETIMDDEKKEMSESPKIKLPLGADERWMMLSVTGLQKPLEYPRIPMKMSDGQLYEEYVIPASDRRKVLEELYLFDNVPAMDELMLDMHSRRKFRVSEYKAIRQNGGNFLVTPLYAQYGGTLLDWMPASKIPKQTDDDEVAVICVAQSFKQKEDDK